MPVALTRRAVVLQSVIACATTILLRGQDGHGVSAPQIPSVTSIDTRLKFTASGKPRPFAGNTVLCHVPAQSRCRDELASILRAFQHSGFAGKLAVLPVESLHMTVHPGAEDQERSNGWPDGVPKRASMEECTRFVYERMKKVRLQCTMPLRLRVDLATTMQAAKPGTITLLGADDAEIMKIRLLRRRLTEAFDFRGVRHEEDDTHITLAYQLEKFTAAELTEYRSLLTERLRALVAAVPVIEFGLPEFCTFSNMYRFEAKLLLQT